MSKFKVGDRVKVVREGRDKRVVSIGACGIIVEISETTVERILVLFDSGKFQGWQIGNEKWWVSPDVIEKVIPRLESYVWHKSADHKLQAEEIEGRIVLEYYIDLSKKLRLLTYLPIVYSAEETVDGMYSGLNTDCKQYMLIDPAPQEEEPMEFEGVKPTIESNDSGCWVQYRHGKVDICTGICESKELAIETWNEWVRAHTK